MFLHVPQKFHRMSMGFLQNYMEILWNYIECLQNVYGILWYFYRNSMDILWKFMEIYRTVQFQLKKTIRIHHRNIQKHYRNLWKYIEQLQKSIEFARNNIELSKRFYRQNRTIIDISMTFLQHYAQFIETSQNILRQFDCNAFIHQP